MNSKASRRVLAALGPLLAAMGLVALAQSEVSRPVYTVFRSGESILLDGRLDEAVWGRAPAFRFVNNRDGSDSPLQTSAKALYDEEFLYFAFQLEDTNIWATFQERDDHLWTEEVVEVFLQADESQSSYIELEVNPLGTMLDIFLLDIRKPLPYPSWNSARLQWAVDVDGSVDGKEGDRGWSCEIALPFEDVLPAPNTPPKPGDRWRLNLYRVEKRPRPAALAWSPTLRPDFHVPSAFGVIEFSGKEVP